MLTCEFSYHSSLKHTKKQWHVEVFYKKKANSSLLKQCFVFYWFYFGFKQLIWLIINHINIFNQLTALKMDSHLFLILLSASLVFFFVCFFFIMGKQKADTKERWRRRWVGVIYFISFHLLELSHPWSCNTSSRYSFPSGHIIIPFPPVLVLHLSHLM